MPLIYRLEKGTPLTFEEGDNNLRYLEDLAISGSLIDTGSFVSTSSFNDFTSSYNIFTSSYNTGSFSGNLQGTSSWADNAIYSSYSLFASSSTITYVSNSNFSLSEIEVADYSNEVAVQFDSGRLKLIFGTPVSQSITSFSFNSTFNTDRFNLETGSYTASAVWNNGGYSLISASIYEGSNLLTSTSSGTSLVFPTTNSGSRTYTLYVTSSNPLNNNILVKTSVLTGTLNKTNPTNPSISTTPSVQLGASSNQIEEGATGSISFTTNPGNSNNWVYNSITTNPISSPIIVVATGSVVIAATASYSSPTGLNSPDLNYNAQSSTTFTRIRSLRAGASSNTSFTVSDLQNLTLWDLSLGGTIGTIYKGTTTVSGQSVTITWSGDKYHYIIYNSSLSNLTNITTSGFGVLGQFTLTTVGNYKVYRTNTLQAGGSNTSITYILT